MTLDTYLTEQGMSATAFAARVGVPASTIIRILNGSRSPRLVTIAQIERASDGAVTVADFMEAPAVDAITGAPAATGHEKSADLVSRTVTA